MSSSCWWLKKGFVLSGVPGGHRVPKHKRGTWRTLCWGTEWAGGGWHHQVIIYCCEEWRWFDIWSVSSQLHKRQVKDNREAEPPGSSSAAQMKKEADGEDSGGSEPSTNRSKWSSTTLYTRKGFKLFGDYFVEKPFGCDVCGWSFTRQEIPKRCMRVHTGDKPFGNCGEA